MSRWRAWVRWMVAGRSDTAAALDALSVDLRALQQQVAALARHLHELDADHRAIGDRQLDEFDRVRLAVSSVADDLSTRISALHERLDASS